MRARARLGVFSAVALLALGAASFVACAKQALGERCDKQNNDDDCASGLVCTSTRAGGPSSICCPPGNPLSDGPCSAAITGPTDGGTDAVGETSTVDDADATPTDGDATPADADATPADSDAATEASPDSTSDAPADTADTADAADAG